MYRVGSILNDDGAKDPVSRTGAHRKMIPAAQNGSAENVE